LKADILYKAQIFGVAVQLVDPRYTSQTCPECGHISKANRPTRDTFCCKQCGYSGYSDYVAARNIAVRAAANQPMVSTKATKILTSVAQCQGQAPLL